MKQSTTSPTDSIAADSGAEPSKVLGLLDRLDRLILKGWRFFITIKFGLFLLSLIGIACIYGTVFFAANSTLGNSAIPLAKAKVFYAPWFIALLAIFFVQFVVSTWPVTKMGVKLWWKKDFKGSKTYFTHGKHGRAVVEAPDGPGGVMQILSDHFTRAHRDGNKFYAHKGLRQRMGPTIIHAGIVIVLVAGLVRILMAKNGMIMAEGRFIAMEGETTNMIWTPVNEDFAFGPGNAMPIEIPYEITVMDFDEVLHPNSTQPAEYYSVVKVRHVETGRVEVVKVDMNHNLRIGGYKFHQASFQPLPLEETWRTNFDIRDARTGERIAVADGEPGVRVRVGHGSGTVARRAFLPGLVDEQRGPEDLFLEVDGEEPGAPWRLYTSKSPRRPVAEGVLFARHAESGFQIEPVEFFPDFTISREDGPLTRSNEPVNPALRVNLSVDGMPVGATLLMMDEELSASLPAGNDHFRVFLRDIQVRGDLMSGGFDGFDWSDNSLARFELEVRDLNSGEVVAERVVGIGMFSDPVIFRAPGADLRPGEDDVYAIYPLERTTRYITVLSVVKEPIVPYYTIGVMLMFFGALITFSGKYRSFHALWDEAEQRLYIAMVPRFGKEPDPVEFAGLLAKITKRPESDFLSQNELGEPVLVADSLMMRPQPAAT